MVQVFICGAVSDFDDPFAWQDELLDGNKYGHDYINAYDCHDFDGDPYEHPERVIEPALDAVRDSDGLLVRWDDDAFLVGAVMYMKEAFDAGLPIVCWYDGYRDDHQIPVQYMIESSHEDRETAIKVLLSMAGDSNALTG